MKIHFDEQTVDVESGLIALHFNVIHDEPIESITETPTVEETPAEAPIEAPATTEETPPA